MTHRTTDIHASAACLLGARVLMLLTVSLVAVMPMTEYFWQFDQFMRGGQDFELSLLAMMTFLCLILVLLQLGRGNIRLLMSWRHWLANVFRGADPCPPGSLTGLIGALHAIPIPSAALSLYNLPLQV